ncbi:beta-ketoacyl-ACP synthase II [Thiocapsa sp.]|uniref:beta-ketoacyl-ACP synthase II n=1 Tax=Thiocapsa sp. TaxID=2024551 RepID=UPI00261B92A1|nr:beta-ketoacyl-ACP synthase II [Thiocapsa sp.]
MRSHRRVVVTGIGMITPFGVGRTVFWSQALAGSSATRLIQGFDPEPYRSQVVGECLDFDPSSVVDSSEVRRYDRFSLFAMAAADEALADSCLSPSSERTGVVMGTGMGGAATTDLQYEAMRTKGRRFVNPLTVPMAMPNAAAGHIGLRNRLRGPSLTISTACASGANAVGEGLRIIAHGYADTMLVGGVEAAINPGFYTVWDALRVMAKRNEDPAGASRPFSLDRTGFVMAEGAAVLVLEEREQAIGRGASIYAEITGYGVTNDAYHVTRPSMEGEANAIRLAMSDAGVVPADVDYINAHGTATAANDVSETNAIKAIFGEHAEKIPISSTKSMIGHSIGAAGAIEFAATCMTIREQIILPTINLETPDPDCNLDYVPNRSRSAEIEVAISNSFGFGGNNAILVARKHR